MYAASGAWTATERDHSTNDVLAVQWDGGPNYAIHGNSIRHLPEINLQGLYATGGWDLVTIVVKLFADGYNRSPAILGVSPVPEGTFPTGDPPRWL